MHKEPGNPEETEILLQKVQNGDKQALEDLLTRHRGIIRKMVDLRMDNKMRGRVDASDIVQEAQLEVANRIQDYLERQPMPFHLWLRKTAYQNLLRIRRQHVEAGCRSVDNEVGLPDRSSILLAQQLMGAQQPEKKLLEQELIARIRQALGELEELDREILLMRQFEGMDNQEVAKVWDTDPKTVSKRFGRALLKLRKVLVSQGLGDSQS